MKRTFQREDELIDFGRSFARRLAPGDVVAISGPLGSGKTTLVRSIVEERLGADLTSSPTFTFWHRYGEASRTPIEHLDLYRIERPSEIAELGLEEAFSPQAIVLVEWWTNAPELLPARRFEIALEGAGDGPRRLSLREPAP